MKTSPASPYLFLPNANQDKDLVLKTYPFYSMFYYTADPDIARVDFSSLKTQNNKTQNGVKCSDVLQGKTFQRALYNKLPFSLSLGVGAANLYFLLVVLMATIVLGTIVVSYWSYLLGNDILEDSFRNTMMKRSVFLSALFVMMTIILSVMLYEFCTLKLSLWWFQDFITTNQPRPVYGFLRNTRKLFIWVFLMLGLVLTLFTTTTLARRARQFKEIIVFNIVAILILFFAQYLYYQNPTSRIIKTFSLFLSVVIMGLVLFLLNDS